MAFSEIQERGRWAQAATLRTYLDAVAASTVLLHRKGKEDERATRRWKIQKKKPLSEPYLNVKPEK